MADSFEESDYERGLNDGLDLGISRTKELLIDKIKHNCSGTEVKRILEIIENFSYGNHS